MQSYRKLDNIKTYKKYSTQYVSKTKKLQIITFVILFFKKGIDMHKKTETINISVRMGKMQFEEIRKIKDFINKDRTYAIKETDVIRRMLDIGIKFYKEAEFNKF